MMQMISHENFQSWNSEKKKKLKKLFKSVATKINIHKYLPQCFTTGGAFRTRFMCRVDFSKFKVRYLQTQRIFNCTKIVWKWLACQWITNGFMLHISVCYWIEKSIKPSCKVVWVYGKFPNCGNNPNWYSINQVWCMFIKFWLNSLLKGANIFSSDL